MDSNNKKTTIRITNKIPTTLLSKTNRINSIVAKICKRKPNPARNKILINRNNWNKCRKLSNKTNNKTNSKRKSKKRI